MFGIVGFEDLYVNCIIGIHPEERLVPQNVLITLQAEVDVSAIASTDTIDQALCYSTLAQECIQITQEGKYQMLETLAYQLIQQLKQKHSNIHWLKITVKKPGAILQASFAYVELEDGKRKRS